MPADQIPVLKRIWRYFSSQYHKGKINNIVVSEVLQNSGESFGEFPCTLRRFGGGSVIAQEPFFWCVNFEETKVSCLYTSETITTVTPHRTIFGTLKKFFRSKLMDR